MSFDAIKMGRISKADKEKVGILKIRYIGEFNKILTASKPEKQKINRVINRGFYGFFYFLSTEFKENIKFLLITSRKSPKA